MAALQTIDEDQQALWNGAKGRAWVEAQAVIDQMFRPLEDHLTRAVPAGFAGQVLDVGCGTGTTTLTIANRLGAAGQVTGIDISAPMLAVASARAERTLAQASFLCADAQDHAFEAAQFDLLVSRLGVMFFADPVAAFANLRRAARPGAALRFLAWRDALENPFMTTAERAAAPHLPSLPPRRPDAPGQFAFADRHRVQRILEESGWREVEIRPVDFLCSFPEPELIFCLSRLGPLGQVLHEADEATRAQVVEAVRAAFEPFVQGADVRYTAACWAVEAQAPLDQAEPAHD